MSHSFLNTAAWHLHPPPFPYPLTVYLVKYTWDCCTQRPALSLKWQTGKSQLFIHTEERKHNGYGAVSLITPVLGSHRRLIALLFAGFPSQMPCRDSDSCGAIFQWPYFNSIGYNHSDTQHTDWWTRFSNIPLLLKGEWCCKESTVWFLISKWQGGVNL